MEIIYKSLRGRAIQTRHWPKPIPIRVFDWEAIEEDWDLGDPIGYGFTEAEAITDLQSTIESGLEEAERYRRTPGQK